MVGCYYYGFVVGDVGLGGEYVYVLCVCGVWCGFQCECGDVGSSEVGCIFVIEWVEYVDEYCVWLYLCQFGGFW